VDPIRKKSSDPQHCLSPRRSLYKRSSGTCVCGWPAASPTRPRRINLMLGFIENSFQAGLSVFSSTSCHPQHNHTFHNTFPNIASSRFRFSTDNDQCCGEATKSRLILEKSGPAPNLILNRSTSKFLIQKLRTVTSFFYFSNSNV
jgi:hypothetical protein